MATITVRALDPVTWEPQYGNGQANFLTDLDAMVQIVATRLRLFEAEWFLNLSDGLPMFQSILGGSASSRNIGVITNLISKRIMSTPHVVSISSLQVNYQNRKLSFKATVATDFGTIYLTNSPGSSANLTASVA